MKKFIAHFITESKFTDTIEIEAENADEAQELARQEARDWNVDTVDTRDLYSFDRIEEVMS